VAVRAVSGITAYFQPVQELTIEDRVSRTQFQFTLTCPDEQLLQEWVPQLIAALEDAPALSDVASDLQNRGLQAFLEIDRDAASRLGVTMADIDDTLYSAFGQRQISTLFTQASQYRVVMEIDPRLSKGPEALTSLFVRTRSGQPVPLSSIARVSERPTTLLINHVGQFPSVIVSFNLGPRSSLGDAVAAIERTVRAVFTLLREEGLFLGASSALNCVAAGGERRAHVRIHPQGRGAGGKEGHGDRGRAVSGVLRGAAQNGAARGWAMGGLVREVGQLVGAEKRDSLWDHPDLLPTSSDIDDPKKLVNKLRGIDLGDAMDQALRDLLGE
jgi:hypothetical protein